jgi:uncharacterized caspase-like protein
LATSKDRQRKSGDTEAPTDALRHLSERLDRASQEARRLAAEAAEAALRGGPAPPASGWAAPEAEDGAPGVGLDALLAALRSARDLVPPELQRRLSEAVRELLLAIRALLDWYIERLDRQPTTASEPEDIPIL